MEAVESMTPEKSILMKESCIERARMFALDSFAQKMQTYFDAPEISEDFLPQKESTAILDGGTIMIDPLALSKGA